MGAKNSSLEGPFPADKHEEKVLGFVLKLLSYRQQLKLATLSKKFRKTIYDGLSWSELTWTPMENGILKIERCVNYSESVDIKEDFWWDLQTDSLMSHKMKVLNLQGMINSYDCGSLPVDLKFGMKFVCLKLKLVYLKGGWIDLEWYSDGSLMWHHQGGPIRSCPMIYSPTEKYNILMILLIFERYMKHGPKKLLKRNAEEMEIGDNNVEI